MKNKDFIYGSMIGLTIGYLIFISIEIFIIKKYPNAEFLRYYSYPVIMAFFIIFIIIKDRQKEIRA